MLSPQGMHPLRYATYLQIGQILV